MVKDCGEMNEEPKKTVTEKILELTRVRFYQLPDIILYVLTVVTIIWMLIIDFKILFLGTP